MDSTKKSFCLFDILIIFFKSLIFVVTGFSIITLKPDFKILIAWSACICGGEQRINVFFLSIFKIASSIFLKILNEEIFFFVIIPFIIFFFF